jgi:hypothetical protein
VVLHRPPVAAAGQAAERLLGRLSIAAAPHSEYATSRCDRDSPDERRVFDELADVIHEELRVQLMMRRLERPDSERVIADLIADEVRDCFEVRRRPTPPAV